MSIRSKLLAPLALLVAFLLLSLGATLALTRAQGDDALKVNLAGRQRMLSQKLARDLLLADRLQDPALLDQARRTLRVFDETLTALQEGGTAPAGLSTEERVTLSAPGSEAAEAIRAFRPQWEPFRGAVLARLEGRGELDPQALAAATAGTPDPADLGAPTGREGREDEDLEGTAALNPPTGTRVPLAVEKKSGLR